ncbi:MAG: alanine racemase [Ruminococcaceae bacterium]|nr:alanine racemase [Oscillospiraceae bacterium]
MYPFYLYTDMPKLSEHKVIAEIDADALLYNYKELSDLTPNTRHICVVKADAYGHTCEICVPALLDAGCDFFAVSCVEEALVVRKICDSCDRCADILILGYTTPRQASVLCSNSIIQTLLSAEYAKQLSDAAIEQGCTVRAHAALDTGMNRIGICARDDQECVDAARQIQQISSFDGIQLEGMYTHFAKADEEYDATVISEESLTIIQSERFLRVRNALLDRGIRLFCHICNSAAAVRFPSLALDGVRMGILLYGIQPSEFINVPVKPVMSLKTLISHIHTLKAGQTVSYGGTYIARKDTTVATVPIGYADGILRSYSGFELTVHTPSGNHKAAIIGRVCMDQCMIDITDLPASVGDEVTVFGSEPCQLRTLSKMAGTIEYESLCLVSARVPRVQKITDGEVK